MKNRYELIVFDLDGTLLTPEFELLPGTIDAVQKIKALPLRVTVATGRSFTSAQPFLDQLDLVEPMVFSNGAVFDNPDNGEREVIQGVPLETALIVAMLQKGTNISLKVHFADGRILKSNPKPWPGEGVHFEVGTVVENLAELLEEDPIKIVFHSEPEELEAFLKRLMGCLGRNPAIRTFRSHDYYIEMTNRAVSKGDAVKLLIEKMGIKASQVIAVGDQENDLEMVRDMGLGIRAGENSALAEVCNYSVASPQQGGIEQLYEYLKTLC